VSKPGTEHFRKLERMYASAPINAYYRPQLEVREGEAELTMQVRRELFHAADAIHGSVYFKALDDVCWFAAASLFDDRWLLTASFNIHLLRPVAEGLMRATGRVVHVSRRLVLADGVLVSGEGRELARGGGSFMRGTKSYTELRGYR